MKLPQNHSTLHLTSSIMKLPHITPFAEFCICRGSLLLMLTGLLIAVKIYAIPNASEWATVVILFWLILENLFARGAIDDAERGLTHLIADCDASLAAISKLALRYESIDKRYQAANLKRLRARDATLRELNWAAFCRRCILLEQLRLVKGEVAPAWASMRSASEGDMSTHISRLARTNSHPS